MLAFCPFYYFLYFFTCSQKIGIIKLKTHKRNIPFEGKKVAKFPNKIPAIQKSVSEKEVPETFKTPSTGITIKANTEIKIPCTNAPNIQPFIPPSAFAKTPAEPPQKNVQQLLVQ